MNRLRELLAIISAMLLFTFCLHAQTIDQRLSAFSQDYAKGYVQPFVDIFGANLNSGLYHSADVSNGLSIYVGVKFMGAVVPSSKQSFDATSPFNGATSSEPTIFGGDGSTIPGSIPPMSYLSGASVFKSVKLIPLLVPQLAVGNLMGTQLMVRYFPTQSFNEIGKVSFIGVGLQHSISQYIPVPAFPVNISAQAVYQSLTLGDNFSAKAYSVGVQASKSLMIVSFYCGLAVEKSTFSLSYNYTNPSPIADAVGAQKISMDFTGSNNFRVTAGLVFHPLPILAINADYNFGNVSVFSLGIGVSI